MERCTLLIEGNTSTNAVVGLQGVWNAFNIPRIAGCTLRSDSTLGYSIIKHVTGGMANVFMVDCGVSTNDYGGIPLTSPDSTDGNGNYVIPAAAR
jgi:hypothetical protein